MKKSDETLHEKNDLISKARRFLDEHERADGTLSETDSATYDKMLLQIKHYNEKAELYRQLERKEMQEFMGNVEIIHDGSLVSNGGMEPPKGTRGFKEKRGVAGNEYHKNFIQAIRTNFKQVQNSLREASLPDGGYLLPVEMHHEIISALAEENILRQIGNVITTESEHKITIVATKPAAAWVAEGQNIDFADESFSQISLSAHKIAIAIKVTKELLQDSYYDLEKHLTQEFANAISAAEEEAMLLGDGVNKPKGLLLTLAEIATGTLQTTSSEITADDLLTLQFSLRRPYRKNAVWLTSDAGLAQIRRLKDSTGNFIWQPSMIEAEPSRLFGQPIFTSEFMPAPTKGNVAILYGDFQDYFLIGDRGQMEFQPLRELFAMSGQVGFLMTTRIDSVLSNPEAIRGLKIRQ